MDLKDIGSMSLDDLGSFVDKAKSLVKERRRGLSDSDNMQVDSIVSGIDKMDVNSIKDKLEVLKSEHNARN